jgi:hypothetical protein
MAWFRDSEIQSSIRNCQQLYQSGIFGQAGKQGPLFQAAVVHLLICLNDLVAKAKIDGQRISDTNFVQVFDDVADVTDLISKCRNAACHISSPLHNLEVGKFTFNVVAGRSPNAFVMNGVALGCDFEDDIAIYYGKYRFYLRRHGLNTLNALTTLYPPRH